MMNTLKSRITEAKKERDEARDDFNFPIENQRNIELQLLHSIRLDLAKEWRKSYLEPVNCSEMIIIDVAQMRFIEQFTGYTPDELKEMK